MERFLPKQKIKTVPMSQEWKDEISSRWWSSKNIVSSESGHSQYVKLHNLLLSIGGEETCFAYDDPDVPKILSRGRFFSGKSRKVKGEPSQCHSNACRIWENSGCEAVFIATGYALSDDGMWRAHSWLTELIGGKTRVIETTTKRIAYFGFEMTTEEAAEFCALN